MPQKKSNAKSKRQIESYEPRDKERINNPPIGLVSPETDPDAGQKKKTYAYEPHLDPQLVWTGKAEHTSFEVPTVSLHVHERIDSRTIIEAVGTRLSPQPSPSGRRPSKASKDEEFRQGRNVNGQVKSRQRVADHGEVLTGEREVKAMLDLVKQETERIDSRFLEPACGTGNFLAEILRRKLRVVEARYAKSQIEYERYAILAVSSIYGIDILEDNVQECRHRLFEIFDAEYHQLFKKAAKEQCRAAVKYILSRNIIHGDALTLQTVGENPQPIIFSEWSLVNGSLINRRDFAFHELISHASLRDTPLFSDLGEEAFIPEPVREYPLVHFLEVANACPD